MELPETFEFSQASLQDFIDCRKRFKLRYIDQLAWPANQAEPPGQNEQAIQRGERFHHLAQQYLLGVPLERLAAIAAADRDEHIQKWWDNFSQFIPKLPPGRRLVEMMLSTSLAGQHLVAKYDLLVITPEGNAVIYDWKTSLRRPSRDWLRRRLQTRVYPGLLVCSGAVLNPGQSMLPDQVEMIYWFPNFPAQPEHLAYDAGQYQEDIRYLQDLIETILALPEEGFTLTPDEKRCSYCVYRSLCDRGITAGMWEQSELESPELDTEGLTLDYDQVAEVEF